MSQKYILSLDQGTTSSRAILFDRDANIVQVSQLNITPTKFLTHSRTLPRNA